MTYRQRIDAALNSAIGAQGIDPAAIDALLTRIPAIAGNLKQRADAGELAFLTLPAQQHDLPQIAQQADRIRDRFAHCVVLGTGGSSLGGLTLASLSALRFAQSGTALHFVENSDPDTLRQLLAQLPLADSFFLVISKSGNTVETLAQWMLVLQAMQAEGLSPREQCLALTMPNDRPLRRLAEAEAVPVWDHDPAVGGRFSALSNVGLLPAAVAGLDIHALRAGADAVLQSCWQDPAQSAPAIGAALLVACMEAGKNLHIVMPYCDRLDPLCRWYRQLWAESIGKNGRGSTPGRALGAVDQHSQLQLWLDGPKDKLLSLITLARPPEDATITAETASKAGMDFLAGQSLGAIIAAQAGATAETLTRHQVAHRHFALEKLDETALGALLQHFMMETAFAAGLLGVDAFDQPAVEQGKQIMRDLLAK